MNWNEIKIHLAPIGSEVRVERDYSAAGTENTAATVVTVYLPLAIEPRPVKREAVELWFEMAAFRATNIRLQSSVYDWEDVSASISTEHGLLANIALTFRAGPDLRERALIWDALVCQICEANRLDIINPATGLEPASEFLKLVERSFAWGYFIEMEKWRRFG